MKDKIVYSIDTSALIDGLERFYPEKTFPGLWDKVVSLLEDGRLIISEEAWDESRKKDLATKEWCDKHDKDKWVVNTDASVAAEVRRILALYPRIVGEMKGRNRADPFVIAVASLNNAVVVTGEGPDGNDRKPKIPYICSNMGIKSITFLQLIKAEGWSF